MKVSALRILTAASIPFVLGLTACAGSNTPEPVPATNDSTVSSSPEATSSPEASEANHSFPEKITVGT